MSEAAFAHVAERSVCGRCGTELAPTLLACPSPSCLALVHADSLKQLAAEAEGAEARGDIAGALRLWRDALERLPPDTKQYAAILERVSALGEQTDIGARQAEIDRVRAKYGKHGAVIGAIAVFILKFKFLIVLVLTKGQLLLLGLTKLSTLSSMAVFLGVDARFLGWQLALGLVLSIYVHEMGHVAALHRHGIKASSPMFIPGVGAFIRAQQRIHGEWAEADVGLAGPLWGLGAAAMSYGVYRATGVEYWSALAGWGALINAFNLTPVWQLDGAHAFKAMSRAHRITAAAALLVATILSGQRMLWLPFLGASWAIFTMPTARRADVRAVGYYVGLAGALALLAALSRTPI